MALIAGAAEVQMAWRQVAQHEGRGDEVGHDVHRHGDDQEGQAAENRKAVLGMEATIWVGLSMTWPLIWNCAPHSTAVMVANTGY